MYIRRWSRPFWQHRDVPSLPVAFQPFEYVFLPVLAIGPLTRVSHNIEEKLVSRYPQLFPIAVADGTLRSRLIPPIVSGSLARYLACDGINASPHVLVGEYLGIR